MTAVNSTDDDQHSAGELLLAREEFQAAYKSLYEIEHDSELLKHAGFEYTAVHDIQGYKERALIMRVRTGVIRRRKALHPGSGS